MLEYMNVAFSYKLSCLVTSHMKADTAFNNNACFSGTTDTDRAVQGDRYKHRHKEMYRYKNRDTYKEGFML